MSIIKTSKGFIQGIVKDNHIIYKGIPYAKPPVGDLRFSPPVENEVWEGTYLAYEFGSKPMQSEHGDEFYDKEFYDDNSFKTKVSEDCLYLNIWTPKNFEGGKLPVAIWIHGGAFLGGCGNEKEFDGEEYCKRDVILVTINYRLGPFGFLVHPWLMEESSDGVAGNYGILDQIQALKWVYENISAFGGNPENITVFGQSAGSMSVQVLVSSELTKDMISKAIFQSAGGYKSPFNRDLKMEDAIISGKEVVKNAGVKSLEELRSLSAEDIMVASEPTIIKGFMEGMKLPFIPVIDGKVLKDTYENLVDRGEVKKIPYIVGSNRDDLFVQVVEDEQDVVYQACVNWCKKTSKDNNESSYAYYFKRELPGDDAGAFHSAELWYMFGTLNRAWRPWEKIDFELSNQMLDLWTEFMKKGTCWSPCTDNDPYVNIFG